jgi:hypothetical protein
LDLLSGYAAVYCSERLQSEVPRISVHGGHSRTGSLLMQTAVRGAAEGATQPRSPPQPIITVRTIPHLLPQTGSRRFGAKRRASPDVIGESSRKMSQSESIFLAISCSSARFSLMAPPSGTQRVRERRLSVSVQNGTRGRIRKSALTGGILISTGQQHCARHRQSTEGNVQ